MLSIALGDYVKAQNISKKAIKNKGTRLPFVVQGRLNEVKHTDKVTEDKHTVATIAKTVQHSHYQMQFGTRFNQHFRLVGRRPRDGRGYPSSRRITSTHQVWVVAHLL